MNDDQANRFAQRMIETWPNGPRRNVWRDIALKLKDHQAARTAYSDLEQTAPHVSTAQFHAAYNAALRRLTPAPLDASKCELCDNSGWVDAPPRLHEGTRTTTQVTPCRCTTGQRMIETHRRINEANRR